MYGAPGNSDVVLDTNKKKDKKDKKDHITAKGHFQTSHTLAYRTILVGGTSTVIVDISTAPKNETESETSSNSANISDKYKQATFKPAPLLTPPSMPTITEDPNEGKPPKKTYCPKFSLNCKR